MNTDCDLYDNVPYRWYVIDDYSADESNVICIFNHAYADGVSFLGIWAMIDVREQFF